MTTSEILKSKPDKIDSEEIIRILDEVIEFIKQKKGKKNHEKECPNTPSDRK